MRNFSNNRGFGSNRNANRDFGGGDRQMYQAVCSECGKDCEVPFRPNGSKPVLCNNCFQKENGGGFRDRSNDRSSFRPRTENFDRKPRADFQDYSSKNNNEALERKLDQIIDMLKSMQPPKPKKEKLPKLVIPVQDEQITPTEN